MKKEVIICLGSSCFARGNKHIVKLVNDYLRERNLVNEVKFHGERCFGTCANGPSLKIDGKLFDRQNEEHIIALLDEFFSELSS
jgi:NADH:ubiquinone oxidoreductase subunit E